MDTIYQIFTRLDENLCGIVSRKTLRETLGAVPELENRLPLVPLKGDSRSDEFPHKIHWFELLAWLEQVQLTPFYRLYTDKSSVKLNLKKKKAVVSIHDSRKRELMQMNWYSHTHFSTNDVQKGILAANSILNVLISLCNTINCEFEDPDFGPLLNDTGHGVCEAYKDFLNDVAPDTAILIPKVFINLSDGDSTGLYSIFKTKSTKKGQPPEDTILWNRPEPSNPGNQEQYEQRLWMKQGPPSAPIQGNIGNGWFIQALFALKHRTDLLNDIVIRHEKSEEKGIYICKFYKDTEWHFIVIDARLPLWIGSYSPVFARNEDVNENWAGVIEKAYAKWFGHYEALSGGSIQTALQHCTGKHVIVSQPPTVNVDNTWSHLAWLLATGTIIAAASHNFQTKNKDRPTILQSTLETPFESLVILCDMTVLDGECYVRISKRDLVTGNDDDVVTINARDLRKTMRNVHRDGNHGFLLNCEPYENPEGEETIIMRYSEWLNRFTHWYILVESIANIVKIQNVLGTVVDADIVSEYDDQWYKSFKIDSISNIMQKATEKLNHRIKLGNEMREARQYYKRNQEKIITPLSHVHRTWKYEDKEYVDSLPPEIPIYIDKSPCIPPPKPRKPKKKVKRKDKKTTRKTSARKARKPKSTVSVSISSKLQHSVEFDDSDSVHEQMKTKTTDEWAKFSSILYRGGRILSVRNELLTEKKSQMFCLLTVYAPSNASENDLMLHVVEPASALESYRILSYDKLKRVASQTLNKCKGQLKYKQHQEGQTALRAWIEQRDATQIDKIIDLLVTTLHLQIYHVLDKHVAKLQVCMKQKALETNEKEDSFAMLEEQGGDECLPSEKPVESAETDPFKELEEEGGDECLPPEEFKDEIYVDKQLLETVAQDPQSTGLDEHIQSKLSIRGSGLTQSPSVKTSMSTKKGKIHRGFDKGRIKGPSIIAPDFSNICLDGKVYSYH